MVGFRMLTLLSFHTECSCMSPLTLIVMIMKGFIYVHCFVVC